LAKRYEFESYHEYLSPGYTPDPENDVIGVFRVTPAQGFKIEEVASGIGAESSTGTWTTLYPWYDVERVKRLSAKVYEILDLGDGSYLVKIAYPVELFEEGNIPGASCKHSWQRVRHEESSWFKTRGYLLAEEVSRSFQGTK
jgi:ribulose 1,5-bisphosphate carboxylase large subunit (EC 4.1.1.39)